MKSPPTDDNMNNPGTPPTDNDAPARKADGESVLALIQQIKDRKLSPDTLSADDRRRCVEVLRGEGYSAPEIAQILKKNERTIYRDLDTIRSANALTLDPQFVEKMAGETIRQAEISMTRLRRIAREAGASAMERLMAEGSAWKVHKELVELFQSLGYLPQAPKGIVADIYQHGTADPIATYDELTAQIKRLELIDAQTGYSDPQRGAKLQLLLDEMNRGRLAAQIERAAQSSNNSSTSTPMEDSQ